MYKLVLISKYLRRKLAPLFAASAVMLCTAMVIIVMSVMGGFLDIFRASAKNLTGDVVVEGAGLQGFTGYEDLVERIKALPGVATATPMIEAFGLVNFGDDARPIVLQGVNLAELAKIVNYDDTVMWDREELVAEVADARWDLPGEGGADVAADRLREALRRDYPADAAPAPGSAAPGNADGSGGDDASGGGETSGGGGVPEAVIGVHVNPYHARDEEGAYDIGSTWAGHLLPVTVVPLTGSGTLGNIEPVREQFLVVNEFKSGLYDVDRQSVLVPFATLQRMLLMDERTGYEDYDERTGRGGEAYTIPGRANRIVIKAAEGVSVDEARDAVAQVVRDFSNERGRFITPITLTWEQVHGQMLGAVENEKGLVTFLFAVIGLVSVVMVATTFYMIVLEKTRDIGVLRAIGAPRRGILGLFLGYGLAIGVVGSLLGLGIAVAVVTNLNEIQAAIAATTGWKMWDPQTYFFDRIPDRVDYGEALAVVAGAVVSSVIGAALPALLAARLRPVDALRYE